MLDHIHALLSSQSAFRVGLLCALILLVIGVIDQLTGNEIALALFYLIPVGIAAWYLSRRVAFLMAPENRDRKTGTDLFSDIFSRFEK